ncbi:MAG TPA: M20/M25/M40 family metallo-hydrolase, partial [Woeseiaceae bacterium]|nr:M20/M25/M40 family metallo-hydrolase [Woeseiaceae bacterium]
MKRYRSLPRTLSACAAFAMSAPAAAAPDVAAFDATERAILEWVDGHVNEAVELLEETVNIGSGTMNHAGVRKVGRVMARELDALGFETRWIDMAEANRAGHLFARRLGRSGPNFLMIGHLDTVFEADDDFQAFARDGDIATGPGVDDMKSGNVIIVQALRALEAAGLLDRMSVVVAYTGDEEKPGEPLEFVRRDLVEAARWADVALGFEAAIRYDGTDWATIARRSSSDWTLNVTGRQAHSSGIFSDEVGAGAIFEAARILAAFYDEVRGEQYLTFNAGTIQGGTDVEYDSEQNRGRTFGKTNVVPKSVVVHGGIRTISTEQLDRARAAMQRIVADSLPHTSATISFEEGYPAMPPTAGNQRLQAELSAINEALGR